MENCPPSGPSQILSSPPKAFICGRIFPEEISSWLIHPKLNPESPSAVLVITLPCQAGTSIIAEFAVFQFNNSDVFLQEIPVISVLFCAVSCHFFFIRLFLFVWPGPVQAPMTNTAININVTVFMEFSFYIGNGILSDS